MIFNLLSLFGKRNDEVADLQEQIEVQAQIIRELGEANALITHSMTAIWAANPRREAYDPREQPRNAHPFKGSFSSTEENGF
ncbi:hypothetical protein E8E11_007384 [Didymella keratinophila]|nr:hypothetical protein E8E11_007384 [Didymella keratinophila]